MKKQNPLDINLGKRSVGNLTKDRFCVFIYTYVDDWGQNGYVCVASGVSWQQGRCITKKLIDEYDYTEYDIYGGETKNNVGNVKPEDQLFKQKPHNFFQARKHLWLPSQ